MTDGCMTDRQLRLILSQSSTLQHLGWSWLLGMVNMVWVVSKTSMQCTRISNYVFLILICFFFSDDNIFLNHILFSLFLWPWPSRQVAQHGISEKALSHTCLVPSNKFLVFIVSEKSPPSKCSSSGDGRTTEIQIEGWTCTCIYVWFGRWSVRHLKTIYESQPGEDSRALRRS